jgi:hypothetical protein
MIDSSAVPLQHGQPAESLLTLSRYLELALDDGACVVLVRRGADICSVYILELTSSGANQMTIGDVAYRFVRSFTHIAERGATVFTPA